MDSTTSTTSLYNFLDGMDSSKPPFLFCSNCQCTEYDPDPSTNNTEVVVRMKLCDVHKVSLLAPNPTTSPGPLSPSPIRQSAPGADTVVAPGIRPGDNRPRTAALVVSLSPTSPPRPNLSSTPVGRSRSPQQHQQQLNRARSRSPLRRPIPSSPTAPGRYRRPTTSNLPSSSLTLYNKVRRKYVNRRDGASIKDIMAAEGISYRTYARNCRSTAGQLPDKCRSTAGQVALSSGNGSKVALG